MTSTHFCSYKGEGLFAFNRCDITPSDDDRSALLRGLRSLPRCVLRRANVATASGTTVSKTTANATQTSTSADATATVPFISTELNEVLWNSSDAQPEPEAIRGSLGATILGPTDDFITVENADLLAPPTTDNGFT